MAGTPEQKRDWLRPCADKFSLVSFCLSEPGAGSDVAGLQLLAEKDGDGYRLNGTKCWITNGGEADLFTVFATLDRKSRHNGICAFVVPADTPGITRGKKEDKMGQRASNTATITFNETEIPADHLIGEENKGFKIAMMTLDRTRPGVAAMATGIARAAMEFAIDYSKERVQFGVPIAMHEAIQFMIADMATDVEASRLLAWHSAVLLDQGKAEPARKVLENWIYWLVIDSIGVYLHTARGLYLYAALFGLYLVLVVLGYFRWRRDWRAQAAPAPA